MDSGNVWAVEHQYGRHDGCGIRCSLLSVAGLFATRKGLISRAYQGWLASQRILGEDLLGLLYRHHSQGTTQMSANELRSTLLVPRWRSWLALRRLQKKGWIEQTADSVTLSKQGLSMAQNVVRFHRLWEHYLAVKQVCRRA